MTSQVLSRQQAQFLTGGPGGGKGDRLRKTLIVSLVLHLCALALLAGFRFKKNVERPLSAVQVSLVTAPAPEPKPEPKVEKTKPAPKPVQPMPMPVPPKPIQAPPPRVHAPAPPVPPKPAPMQAKPAPAPSPPPAPVAKAPVQPAPAPRPAPALVQPGPPVPTLALPQPVPHAVKPSPTAPVRSRKDVMEDLLKDIELPPNAPQFGDVSPLKPAESRRPAPAKLERAQPRPQNDLAAAVKKLKVPEIAVPAPVEPPKEMARPVPVPPKVPSLSEELDRELKELKPMPAPPAVKLPEPVRQAQPLFRDPPRQQPVQRQTPPVSASVPQVKAPDMMLKIPGMASGSNPYLARVQARISSFWTPVDAQSMQDQTLAVVVRFRLHRSGKVSDVVMEQPSGNDYFDLAARRAILSAEPLPTFPPDIKEPYFDAHFTFAVGEAG